MLAPLLSAYIPVDRCLALACGQALSDPATGAALFADISGCTPLAEALAARLGPQRAAEELAHQLNQVYDTLVEQVNNHRGSVVGFVGDAITCWFDDTDLTGFAKPVRPTLRAVACALAMQEAIRPFTHVKATQGITASIAIKVGIAAGPVRRFRVGDPDIQYIDVLAGETMRQMSLAEGTARRGEVLLDATAVAQVERTLTVREWRAHPTSGGRFAVATSLAEPVDPMPWLELPAGTLTENQLRPWVLPPIYQRLKTDGGQFLAELRPAVSLFLKFGGLDYDHDAAAGDQLDAYIRWVQRVVTRYEGSLIQLTIGDKGSFMYAAFGAPVAHDDDALCAVRAAFELQALPAELGFITGTQIGVARGPARTGDYGSTTRRSYGVIGDEAVLAARLMAAAPPGEIRCAYSIYRELQQKLAFVSLPPVRVKGKAGLVRVYRPSPEPQSGGGAAEASRAAIVGRRAEITEIETLLDAVQAGATRVLIVEGEAGIGKSRLVDELKRLARERGLTGLVGNGQSIEQQTPYRAWRDVFSSYFQIDNVTDADERQQRVQTLVLQLAPDQIQRLPLFNDVMGLGLPDNDLIASLDPDLRQQNLMTLLMALLRAWAVERPLILVLEDAHWLDSLSWQLAIQVARSMSLAHASFLLVIVNRPLDENSVGQTVFRQFQAMDITRTLVLSTLAPDEIVTLIVNRLGVTAEALPAPLVELAQTRSNGNPFFAEELILNLRDQGILEISEVPETSEISCRIIGNWENAQRALPDTLHGLVLTRIDRLPPERQFVLKVAAVIGRTFTFAPLYYAVNQYNAMIEQALKDHLALLITADFTLLESLEPDLTYLFKHIITQEAAYQTLLFAQRRKLHRLVAQWYEARQDAQAFLPLLVHHYHQAEDREKERHYLRLAGEATQAAFANDAALDYFSRLLPLLTQPDELVDIHLKLGSVLEIMGNWPKAEKHDQAALTLANRHGDMAIQALCQKELGILARLRGEYSLALGYLEQAHLGWIHAGNPKGACQALAEIGVVFWRRGEYESANTYLTESLKLARETGDKSSIAYALNHLANVARRQNNYPAARQIYEESLALWRELNDKRGISTSLSNLGLVAQAQGDLHIARALLSESLTIRREMGDISGISTSLINLGLVAQSQDDNNTAQACFEESLALSQMQGDRDSIAWGLIGLAYQARSKGNMTVAHALFTESLGYFRESNNKWESLVPLISLGDLALEQGKNKIAEAYFRESITLSREIGGKRQIANCLVGLAGVAANDPNGDRRLAARLLAAADHIFAAIGAEMEPDERRACEHTHATIRATLSEAEFSTAWSEGAQMTLEQATDYALGVASEENAPEHRKMVTEWRKTSPSVEEG